MEKRIAIVLALVFVVGAVANASEQWNNNVTYNGNWSDPNWFDSGTATLVVHPGGTVDTRISADSTVTVDANDAQCGPLFVSRGVGSTSSGTLVLNDDSAHLLVSKASTELLSVGYEGTGVINHSAGTLVVDTAENTSEVRISHGASATGIYNLSGTGLLDSERLCRGAKNYPGTFNATGGTLIVRAKIYKFGLVSEGYGFSQGGALFEPGGIGEVGSITIGDSGNKTDYAADANSVIEFDIASDSSYDKVVSFGNFALDSCTIKLNFLGEYTPGVDSFFDVWTTLGGDTNYTGSGAPTVVGSDYLWMDLDADGRWETLRIPEPASLTVLVAGLGLLLRRRRS